MYQSFERTSGKLRLEILSSGNFLLPSVYKPFELSRDS